MMVARLKVPLAALLLTLAAGSQVLAADGQAPLLKSPATPANEWTFAVASYVWASGIKGDVGLFGQEPSSVDKSFGDLIKDFKFGGMAVAGLHNGTWGLFGDIMYARTRSDGSATRIVDKVPVALSAAGETSSFTGTLMGEYRPYSTPAATLDLMAGMRLWSVDNDINLALTAGGAPIAQFSGSDGGTWVDPIIGIKGRFNIDDKWYLDGWAMIGGFGVASDVTWDVMANIGYHWNDKISFAVGYRAMGVDYSHGGFVYDVVQRGPVIGSVMKF
jgi:hypothetical protein